MEQNVCCGCFRERTDNPGPCPHCGYDPASDQDKYPFALPHGSILAGRFITGRVLGQGGFGITYLALDYQSGMRVAIKEYMPDGMAVRTSGTPQVTVYTGQRQENFQYGMEHFLDEAKVLAKFQNNSNIVGVQSYFEENGTAYFVMEYVEGVSFKSYIQEHGGKIAWEDAVRILMPVMEALAAVHKEGIIHRDVKPDNVLLTAGGQVKLLDFGSARYSLGDKSRSLDVILTAGYAPKEQYTRRGRQGPYTDVYSLAACFYAAVTGYLPPESLERMDEDNLVLPSTRGIRIPQAVEDVMLHGLEVQPADRFQSMEEFRAALDAALRGEYLGPVSEPEPEPVPGLVLDPKPDDTDEIKKDSLPDRIKDLPMAVKGCAAAVACLAIVLSIAFGRSMIPGGTLDPVDPVESGPVQDVENLQNTMQDGAPLQEKSYVTNYFFLPSDSGAPYTYTGEMSGGIPNGNGTASYTDGTEYVGEFKNGWPDGTGTMIYADGGRYEGEWEGGGRSGTGTMIYADGGRYEGEWERDSRSGTGTHTWADGENYKGEWKDDMMNGTGTYTWADGNKYMGKWKDNLRNGTGAWTSTDGENYEGEWKDDMKNGTGTYVWADGNKYMGEWKDNLRNGIGVYTWADGCRFEGEWKNDERNGMGTIVYADGGRFEGEWKNDKKNGIGTWTYANGAIRSGEWKDNKFVSG